ncbi:hypothetical protein M413DRAFT_127323 [Hebeloma cylindrosporum]|uniref:Uncharacterized protein n=1 Tax=Hebeloma cylindrosporum TaxID=76867 RepID=A0A0C3CD22_HEBCY|nr:hypothetical protein M413DRAFT_127323 [Hebeloma cylindrosporum h7]
MAWARNSSSRSRCPPRPPSSTQAAQATFFNLRRRRRLLLASFCAWRSPSSPPVRFSSLPVVVASPKAVHRLRLRQPRPRVLTVSPPKFSSSLQARRGILVTRPGGSGGNDPARGRDSGGSSSSRRHQPSPLRQTLATAESGSPPPPPPPHFPPPAEDDDGHDEAASGFSVDWISIALVIPIFVQLKKIFFGRARRSDGRSATLADGGGISDENVADTSSEDPTCDNILPLSDAKVLPKPIPTTHDADRACRNFLPLTTHRSSTIIGSRDHPTHLPGLAPRGSSIHDSKAIEVAGTGLSLGFLSTVVFMVGAFISPLVPLVFYRIAVRQPESSEPAGQGTDSADSADGESSEEGEVYDMVLERPEVRPVEDQVCLLSISTFSEVFFYLTTIINRFLRALLCISVR